KKRVFILQLRRYKNKFWIRSILKSNTTQNYRTAWTVVPQNPVSIEMDWKAAKSKLRQNGFIRIWVNGTIKLKKIGLNNSMLRVNEVRLGITSPIKSLFNISGSYYLDDFISTRLEYIGP
ncbi:MAG: hypothetical protein OEY93_04825, partial [Anaerolineae bacterium]|nr:hypothetical protein [Anaerolineae bacterium]